MEEFKENTSLPEWLERLTQRSGTSLQLNKQGTLELLKARLAIGCPNTPEELDRLLKIYETYAETTLRESPKLKDFVWERSSIDIGEIESYLDENEDKREYLAFYLLRNLIQTKQSFQEEKTRKSAFSMYWTFWMYHALFLSDDGFINTFWQGSQVNALKRILNIWNQNKTCNDEEFWQTKLSENPAFICQVFPYPVVIFQDKAFVGGTRFTKKGGREVDFLLKNSLTENVVLLEIKTPGTKLLGKKYRNTYGISPELSGVVGQMLAYRDRLLKSFVHLSHDHRRETDEEINAFNPTCLILGGNISLELTSPEKRDAFELFRSELKNISIISFDELFRKAENLLNLFE
ncbi:Shedu immune nuclease family protein [Leptothoe sp. ISB3NOV94-8A]